MSSQPMWHLLCGYRVTGQYGHWLRHADESKTNGTYSCAKVILSKQDSVQVKSFSGEQSGHIILVSKSRAAAYDIANMIRGVLAVLWHCMPRESSEFYLQELKTEPQDSWTVDVLTQNIEWFKEQNWHNVRHSIRGGTHLRADEFERLGRELITFYEEDNLRTSLQHLFESVMLHRDLHYDYEFWHKKWGKERARSLVEKTYHENRLRNELSFLAAFKGLESFLGESRIKKKEIAGLFDHLICSGITHDCLYRRHYEISLGMCSTVSYKNATSHWLDMRNATAAHSNRTPPEHLMVTAANVAEIQAFLCTLIRNYLASNCNS